MTVLTPQEEEQFQTSDPSKYPEIPGLLVLVLLLLFFVSIHVCMHYVSAGFVGAAKGAKQMLWERGRWRAGLTLSCCRTILKNIPDFRLETSDLISLCRDRRHGFELGVKCHPDMTGCGVEYCWGKVCVFVCARDCVLCTRCVHTCAV